MKGLAALGLAVMGLAPAGAWASEQVLGDNTAAACYEASHSTRTDKAAVHLCDVALDAEIMTPAARGGALINRGVIKMRRKEWAAAQADFDAGLALVPDLPEGWFNRGATFIGEKRYQDAVANFDKAIALGVHEAAKAYYYRGIAHEYLNDEKAAYQDYDQAEQLAPDWDLPKHELLRFTVSHR